MQALVDGHLAEYGAGGGSAGEEPRKENRPQAVLHRAEVEQSIERKDAHTPQVDILHRLTLDDALCPRVRERRLE